MSRKLLSSAILCTLMTGTTIAFVGVHASTPSTYELPPVVVTATRMEESVEKVPASVSVVTAKEIADHNYSSTAQAVGQLPGIYLDPKNDGNISMRGFNSTDILVMVDGQPVNSGWDGTVDWSLIPIQNIEKIEVVRGAASSLYGGRAAGGVIQITTKKNREEGLHGDIILSTGSHHTTTQGYNASIKKDKLDISAGYEKRKTDGWPGFFIEKKAASSAKITGPVVNVALDTSARDRYIVGGRGDKALTTESYHVKTTYHFDTDQSLTYSYSHSNNRYFYTNPFSFIKDADGNELFYGKVVLPTGKQFDIEPVEFLGYVGQREWAIHNLNYTNVKNKIHAHIGMTDIKKAGYSSSNGPKQSITPSELEAWNGKGTFSFYPSKTKDFDVHKTWNMNKHTLLAGIGYRSDSFDQTKYKLDTWRNLDSNKTAYELHGGKDEAWSAYAQDKWQASERLTTYMGVRFDRYKKYGGYGAYLDRNVADTYGEGVYTEWSPKLSLEYALPNDVTLFASYGHSFTPPILYKVYRDGGAEIKNNNGKLTVDKKSVLANPDLQPETANTFEIGIKKKWGHKTFASATLYKTVTKNAINYYKTNEETFMNGVLYKKGFSQYRNFGESKKTGIELEGTHKFNNVWSSYVNYAWESESIDGEHNYSVPKHLLHFGVAYTNNRWNILADAQYVSERQQSEVKGGTYYSEDPFFITNLAVNYDVTEDAKLQFTVYNLFDRNFYASEAASRRTYTMGLHYFF